MSNDFARGKNGLRPAWYNRGGRRAARAVLRRRAHLPGA